MTYQLYKVSPFESLGGVSRTDVFMNPFIFLLTCYRPVGHRCGCMSAKQMGSYSDGCAFSGEGRVVSCYNK